MERTSKVKISSKGRVTVEWEKSRPGTEEPDTLAISCNDQAHPDLIESLNELLPHVGRMLEVPQPYIEDGMVCSGVSFSWKEGIMGAVVTCQKELHCADAPLVLNTPHLPEMPYGEGESPVLRPEMVDALKAVDLEARLYTRGKRAQGDLFPAHTPEVEEELALV